MESLLEFLDQTDPSYPATAALALAIVWAARRAARRTGARRTLS